MAVHSMPSQGNDVRLIEAGFPCHQVGAETQRERDTGESSPYVPSPRVVGPSAADPQQSRRFGLTPTC